jgi:hypothetical protein
MTAGDWMIVLLMVLVSLLTSIWVVSRQLGSSRRARAELTSGKEYRALTDEYRRLSDMAITAQEHIDLRLTDLTVQVDALRGQLDQMQRILKEVE